jgi:tetratricopeptide (TPR) repeat protein
LGALYNDQGRYDQAEQLYKRALAIFEKVLGPDHHRVTEPLGNLATLYLEQARYAEAEPILKRALAVREKGLGPEHPDLATALHNLGSFYSDRFRFAEAEMLLQRALTIREKAFNADHPEVAATLNNLAEIHRQQGALADAEPLQRRALKITESALGQNHPDVAQSLNNLGLIHFAQGNFKDAESDFRRAIEVDERVHGPDHPSVALEFGNLAEVYNVQGRYADAESLAKRALIINEKAFGPKHLRVVTARNNLAAIYDKHGRYEPALSIVRANIDQGTAFSYPTFSVLRGALISKLISEADSFADSYKAMQSFWSEVGQAARSVAQRFAAGSAELAEIARKEQDLAIEDQQLDKDLIAAVSRAPSERNPAAEEAMRKRHASVSLERQKLLEMLAKQFPNYIALADPQPLTLQETQDLLADDEAVVAFNIRELKSYAWVVTKTDAEWTEIPVNAKTLNEEITKLRQSLTFEFGSSLPFDTALSYSIYKQIFGPVADKLKGKARLSVLGDGALTSLPVSLLITSNPEGKSLKEQDWLIRSHAITVIPSIFSLKTMRAQLASDEAKKPMIAFADPVFSKEARAEAKTQQVAMRSLSSFYRGSQLDARELAESLPQLPGTRKEVEAIAKALNVRQEDLRLGLDATEQEVKHAIDDSKTKRP